MYTIERMGMDESWIVRQDKNYLGKFEDRFAWYHAPMYASTFKSPEAAACAFALFLTERRFL